VFITGSVGPSGREGWRGAVGSSRGGRGQVGTAGERLREPQQPCPPAAEVSCSCVWCSKAGRGPPARVYVLVAGGRQNHWRAMETVHIHISVFIIFKFEYKCIKFYY
jgi:hypothetical protein